MQNKNQTFVFAPTPAVAAVQTTLFLLLFLTGVLGNGSICFLLFRFKSLRTYPNMLLTHLATVDFFDSIINVPLVTFTLIYDLNTLSTHTAAWWTTFFSILFVVLNLTSMSLLVLDRYLALAHYFKYMLWRSRRKYFFGICAVWMLSIFIAGGMSIPTYNADIGAKSLSSYRKAYTQNTNSKYYIMPLILTLLTPIVGLSIVTMRELVCKKSRVKTSDGNAVQELRKTGRGAVSSTARSASTIMIVLLMYIVCFICGSTFKTIAMTYSDEEFQQWFRFIGVYTLLCGSSCNSFIYAVRSSQFRNALRQTFKGVKCFQNQVQHQKKAEEEAVFYINGHFGKQQIYINNSLLTGIPGQYVAKPI